MPSDGCSLVEHITRYGNKKGIEPLTACRAGDTVADGKNVVSIPIPRKGSVRSHQKLRLKRRAMDIHCLSTVPAFGVMPLLQKVTYDVGEKVFTLGGIRRQDRFSDN